MITTVTNTSGLSAAITHAHDGDTILLAPGAYAELRLYNVHVAGNVTITSADPAHQATIAGLNFNSTSGLSFSNVEVTVAPDTGFAAYLLNSNHINLDQVNLHGAAVGNGNAAMVRNSDTISITNSNIHDVGTGINHQDSSHLTFSGNTIHAIQFDGIRGGGSSFVTISGNTFTDFHPAATDHPDAIQFWTTGVTTLTHDITITNNTVVRGPGAAIQGIFLRDETSHGYQNITVTGNAVIGGHFNGISVLAGDNVNVSNNLVEAYGDQGSSLIISNTTHSTEANNVSTYFDGTGNVGLAVSNDVKIASGAVGDTSLLSTFQATHTTAGLHVTAPTPTPTPPPTATTGAPAATAPVITAPVVTTPPPPVVTTAPPTSTLVAGPAVTIHGTAGDDHLMGTSGNDVIDGGAGADTISGGLGNDTYIVSDSRDMIVEAFNGGVDTVRTSLTSYTLGNQLDNLTLTGTSAQTGTGNELNNVLTANGFRSTLVGAAGNDTLVATGGLDTLTGGAGNDVFRFDKLPSGTDTITDFAKGDQLNLHNLLTNYHGTNPVADHWVQFVNDATGTTVYVDSDGAGTAHGFTAVAKLVGVHSALTAGTDWIF